ncbi:tail protein [Stenotrophomonas phage vB_SmaS_DLP_5]|uniref:Tail protein n=1 Tax=Stenotrophomonas phage vB_SmaS_DLP_5 TaxID=2044561 RepID=A0A2D2W2I1_9CAUD|nr:tail completion or Neck1 protein [Stenotrophomonas phage vB_SmaS_DLP_5]ATS92347.1 tail protein [Stenotrophomonas phage vB_SmaS_DLP_5]
MLRITIDDKQIDEALELISGAVDPVKLVDEAAAILLSRIRRRYLDQTAPDGTKWVPSYAAQLRAKSGRGGGTLYDTGRLFNSIQLYADTDTSRLIGTDVPYGKIHNDGIGVIRRQFLGANEEDMGLMVKLVVNRIKKALG